MNTLRYNPLNKEYSELILVNQIVRLSKSDDGEITYIHLTNGEIIETNDSINTLEARLNH